MLNIKLVAMFFAIVLQGIVAYDARAFIMDSVEKERDTCPASESRGLAMRPPDISCVSQELGRISKLPLNEIDAILESMVIEEQVDVYLCSCQARLDYISKKLLSILSDRLPGGQEYLIGRLGGEHDDYRIADLLSVFILYGVDKALDAYSKKGDYLTADELPFSPEMTRFLVSKAEEIHKQKARDLLLDYLIPLLPRDEAVAGQAKRDEATQKSSK